MVLTVFLVGVQTLTVTVGDESATYDIEVFEQQEVVIGEMVLVTAGTTSSENGSVSIVEDIYVCKYEVSQGEFEELLGFNPARFNGVDGVKKPVEQVSWYDAVVYCNAKSEEEGLNLYYTMTNIQVTDGSVISAEVVENYNGGYRLLTSTEWEYCARGGELGENTIYSGSNNVSDVAWYVKISSETNISGEKLPNELGLYDMSGNVWEWCGDWWDEEIQTHKMVKGGCWSGSEIYCEVDKKYSYELGFTYDNVGFRVARTKKGTVE